MDTHEALKSLGYSDWTLLTGSQPHTTLFGVGEVLVFCDACGAGCPDASAFCSKCGRPFIASSSARRRFDTNALTRRQTVLIVLGIVGFLVICGLLTDTSKPTPAEEQTTTTGGSGSYLNQMWNMLTEKATHDCVASRGLGQCETGEELDPFRVRLVLFILDEKEVWLGPDDNGFRTLQPAGADAQRHRAEVLAQSGDYSGAAIYFAQSHVKPTEDLRRLYPDMTAAKLFYENKPNSAVWSAVDNKRWCGDGCWMVWCVIKPDKERNVGPIGGYWEVNLTSKRITTVDKTATQKFFVTDTN